MRLYPARDYFELTEEEAKERELIDATARKALVGKVNVCSRYPDAVRHHISLFPNNHIDLQQMRSPDYDMRGLNDEFRSLVHCNIATEQDILRFINKKPAYHIIGSLFSLIQFRFCKEGFGHHESYLFPEFQLGIEKKGSRRPDYLLVGKSSGGYEFVFVEFEKSIGRIALQNGHLGECYRKGIEQVNDWRDWLPGYFNTDVAPQFERMRKPGSELPSEFLRCEPDRYHYAVVAGLREHYKDETYRDRRRYAKQNNIYLIHYDNLCDSADELLEEKRLTF